MLSSHSNNNGEKEPVSRLSSLKRIVTNNLIRKKNSCSPPHPIPDLFWYDFEKSCNWTKYYPKSNLKNILFITNAKRTKQKMSQMFSRESLDKRKINRIVVVHSPKKSYSRVTSQRRKSSFPKDWGSMNHEDDGNFSVLSKNILELDTPKEISRLELKK